MALPAPQLPITVMEYAQTLQAELNKVEHVLPKKDESIERVQLGEPTFVWALFLSMMAYELNDYMQNFATPIRSIQFLLENTVPLHHKFTHEKQEDFFQLGRLLLLHLSSKSSGYSYSNFVSDQNLTTSMQYFPIHENETTKYFAWDGLNWTHRCFSTDIQIPNQQPAPVTALSILMSGNKSAFFPKSVGSQAVVLQQTAKIPTTVYR